MEQFIKSRMEIKVKRIKRKTLGLCGRVSFKSEIELASILKDLGILNSRLEAREVIKSFPNVLELNYPLGESIDLLRIIRLGDPSQESNPIYKITIQLLKDYR